MSPATSGITVQVLSGWGVRFNQSEVVQSECGETREARELRAQEGSAPGDTPGNCGEGLWRRGWDGMRDGEGRQGQEMEVPSHRPQGSSKGGLHAELSRGQS